MEPITALKINFPGRGEVKGFEFTQIMKQVNTGYVYEVKCIDSGRKHFEVFSHKENKHRGYVAYPKSTSFGKWAWSYPTKFEAIAKFEKIIHEKAKSTSRTMAQAVV